MFLKTGSSLVVRVLTEKAGPLSLERLRGRFIEDEPWINPPNPERLRFLLLSFTIR